MRNANIDTWVNDLLVTEDHQCTGQLAEVDISYGYYPDDAVTKRIDYCCLGKGSTLVPNMPQFWPGGDAPGAVYFGAVSASQLAPREFMEWLGYEIDPIDWPATSEWDVFIDWPEDLRMRSGEDYRQRDAGGDRAFDRGGNLLRATMSCANLNDAGFSFAQIGMLVKHFGLTDQVKPEDA